MRRLFPLLLAAATALLLAPAAHAAPIGTLKQFRVPTANSSPLNITLGADGNFWFTESGVLPPSPANLSIGRITPAGAVTEFPVCTDFFCNISDIVQGPGNVLYFTTNNPGLGRITTSGTVLPTADPGNNSANGNGIAAFGDFIYYTDFNNDFLWRYRVSTGTFTSFPVTPGSDPSDVATDGAGNAWFTDTTDGMIGRLDAVSGAITYTDVPGIPRALAIASDGAIWFTERFDNAVGRLPGASTTPTMFPQPAGSGPNGITAAAGGAVWFTNEIAGNVVRITPAGVTSEGKSVKGSQPFGVTVATPGGNPWYAEMGANKIATLQLR